MLRRIGSKSPDPDPAGKRPCCPSVCLPLGRVKPVAQLRPNLSLPRGPVSPAKAQSSMTRPTLKHNPTCLGPILLQPYSQPTPSPQPTSSSQPNSTQGQTKSQPGFWPGHAPAQTPTNPNPQSTSSQQAIVVAPAQTKHNLARPDPIATTPTHLITLAQS